MDSQVILQRVLLLVPLMLSLSVHEWAHAFTAWKLGDDTAARQGRLTLNPLAHADLVGTILLPLLLIPFGWAKPVPVNPARFRRDVSMRTGMMLTAAAGPLSNVVLAVLLTLVLGFLHRVAPAALDGPAPALLGTGILLNVTLAVFNLLPVPPLDGSRIVDGLVPLRLRPQWEAFSRAGPFLLLGLLFFGGRLVAAPVSAIVGRLLSAVV